MFIGCAQGRAPIPFPIMRSALIPAVLLLACSSDPGAPSQAGGGSGGELTSGGSTAPTAGSAPAGAAGAAASGGAQGGKAGEATTAGTAGEPPAAGGQPSATGGAAGQAGEPDDVSAGAGGQAPTTGEGGAAGAPDEPVDPCVCDAGPCCDGCHYRPASHFCGLEVYDAICFENTRQLDYRNLFCSGSGVECTRWSPHIKWLVYKCGADTMCVDAGTGGDDATCE